MNLTHKTIERRGAARFATTTLSLLLIAGACTSALAFRMQVTDPPTKSATPPTKDDQTDTVTAPDKVMHLGGAIKPPVVIHMGEPQYTQQARDAKFSGNILVHFVVEKNGDPSHVRVVTGAGMGLDERAVEAVRQYKFKPATLHGNPVRVDLYVDVAFRMLGAASPTQATTPPSTLVIGVPHSATAQPAQSFKVDVADASGPNPRINTLSPAAIQANANTSDVVIDPKDLKLISHATPIYPKSAKAEKINGTVELHVLIGKNGVPKSVTVLKSARSDLDQAAIDATKKDRFQPYLLNGRPVEVAVDIFVNFVVQ